MSSSRLSSGRHSPSAPPRPPAVARPAGQRRAPTPDWGISSAGIGAPVAEIHPGDCFAGGKALQPISAKRPRAEPDYGVQACGVCRPDNVLTGP
ncbi:DUF6233 domain-containing protein [Streptomyces sp. EN16]|uniref:DUF6233 domain-containing protein n=1 Tax=Streptomyces sp. EN16 TaxID=212773 RepID=UPI003521EF65